ncbi:Ltp family lipoprotein [Nocardioides sp. AX2bis]|uniref:Ltp family lipoprotein n=1 Tax=Nocardioides sp. AX2bis TaxID=2653157 RepID=UPI0012F2399F|nr:Ltp family lipoprotein [Nocardioides sp. AX2bis]VXB34746.1 hypothetical protein NOCARDAX2BIS_210102 [Nocardioides sp. AX2bis]
MPHDAPRRVLRHTGPAADLPYTSFSRTGLIEQLQCEGHTLEQATYGVNQTGL